ncbi:MAG: hypothetical protein LAO51_13550 [Acidobacteriia bacterium]|nr:hypothetical protein [Terriglobia bacterium]
MITDDLMDLSRDQAITATAASTDYYDARTSTDLGAGEHLHVWAKVTEAFNNLTSLTFALQCDDDPAFGTAATLWTTAVLLAGLTLNKPVPLPGISAGNRKRYWRLYYTVTGTAPTTGKISAGFNRGKSARPELTY